MGPAWDDLLFPYQMTWFGSVACGIGALLCLERETRNWDIAATVLLVGGLLFSDAGIPFVAGAAVEVAPQPATFDRAFVPIVPTVLWGLWYLGWGHTAHTFISFENVANLPSYVLDGLSSSIVGVPRAEPALRCVERLGAGLGRPLLLLVVALAVWRVLQLRTATGPSPGGAGRAGRLLVPHGPECIAARAAHGWALPVPRGRGTRARRGRALAERAGRAVADGGARRRWR